MTGRVNFLPLHVANQIAAGEVVERPASVVKELLENALDAGADRIEVEVAGGGRDRIEVSDNGSGMSRDDALMSVERHATSKIEAAGDIARIATLGFRGEALAAISSVSRFRLVSCSRERTVGTAITIAGGKIEEVSDTGAPAGTAVQVSDLFYNLPARRKFMRAKTTELSHVRTVFLWYALAYPGCSLALKIDGREGYRLAGGASLADRVRELYGSDIMTDLASLDWQDGDLRISGYISSSPLSSAGRAEQYVFINSRPASAPLVSYALREACSLPDSSRRPLVFLFVGLPFDQVDVNVHPTKREVRFKRPAVVRDGLIAAIREALAKKQAPGLPAAPGRPAGRVGETDAPVAPPPAAWRLDRVMPAAGYTGGGQSGPPSPDAGDAGNLAAHNRNPGKQGPWIWFRLLGRVGERYALIETDGGLVTLDQRAAHERVLYERLVSSEFSAPDCSQTLLMPVTVKMSPADAHNLRRHLPRLNDLGFSINDFGDDSFMVDALPEPLVDAPCRELLVSLSEGLATGAGKTGEAPHGWRHTIARAASRLAISARRRLSLDELRRLVEDLATCRMPYVCPHGRPTMVFTSLRELDRKFGRG